MSLAILGIGVHLPPKVRSNDHWTQEAIERWMGGRAHAEASGPPQPLSEGHRKVLAAMAEFRDDPFSGAVERRVLADDQLSSDMEAAACRDALERAGVAVDELDFILEYSTTPDFIVNPNACVVHHKIGAKPRCFTISVHGECNAFMHQMHLAKQLLRGGYRKGLLVQAAIASRLTNYDAPFSPWFGDGATAVVVGAPRREGQGLIADAQRTDSSLHTALVAGAEGRGDWSEGPIRVYVHDGPKVKTMLAKVADHGVEVLGEALESAGKTPMDVDFYASHQATAWFRRVTQDVIGMHRARAVDTFSWAGSLQACNLPLVMATAERDGTLREGDLVAMYAGGSGITYSGAVMRW